MCGSFQKNLKFGGKYDLIMTFGTLIILIYNVNMDSSEKKGQRDGLKRREFKIKLNAMNGLVNYFHLNNKYRVYLNFFLTP